MQVCLFTFWALSLLPAQLAVSDIPIRDEEMARFATTEYLVENATASLHGCHLLVASSSVAELVVEELKKHNFSPERIGTVTKRGAASVTFGANAKAGDYVAAKTKLDRLSSAPVQQPTP